MHWVVRSALQVFSENRKSQSIRNQKSLFSVEKAKPSEIFEGIQATHILPDKRRTRIKSTARPPSQVFLKDNILQKYNSFEDLDALSDDENLIKTPQKPIRKISDLSQVVFELNHRINMKTVQQKETTIKAASTENLLQATKHAQKPDAKKSEHAGQTVPWLKELQNRREHKLSLRGDETFEKITGEIFNREANFLGKKSEIKIEAIPEKRQVTRSSSNTSLLTKSTFFEKSTIEQSKMTMVAKEKVESKDVEAPLIKLQGKLTDATKKESEVTVKPESGSLSASENVAVVSNAAEGLIKNAVQGLLKNIDGFLLKSKARQDSFQEEINKLQEMLDREYQQDKAFVENLRAELKALAENKRAE